MQQQNRWRSQWLSNQSWEVEPCSQLISETNRCQLCQEMRYLSWKASVPGFSSDHIIPSCDTAHRNTCVETTGSKMGSGRHWTMQEDSTVFAVNRWVQNLKFHREVCEISLLPSCFPPMGNCYWSYPMKEDLTHRENLCQCPVEMGLQQNSGSSNAWGLHIVLFLTVSLAQNSKFKTLSESGWTSFEIPRSFASRVEMSAFQRAAISTKRDDEEKGTVLMAFVRLWEHLLQSQLCYSPGKKKSSAQTQVFNCCSEHPKTHESRTSDLYWQGCKENICFD